MHFVNDIVDDKIMAEPFIEWQLQTIHLLRNSRVRRLDSWTPADVWLYGRLLACHAVCLGQIPAWAQAFLFFASTAIFSLAGNAGTGFSATQAL